MQRGKREKAGVPLPEGDLPVDRVGRLVAELRWPMDREWARAAVDVVWRRSKLGLGTAAEAVGQVTAAAFG